jgi:hypothetical protein
MEQSHPSGINALVKRLDKWMNNLFISTDEYLTSAEQDRTPPIPVPIPKKSGGKQTKSANPKPSSPKNDPVENAYNKLQAGEKIPYLGDYIIQKILQYKTGTLTADDIKAILRWLKYSDKKVNNPSIVIEPKKATPKKKLVQKKLFS